MRVLAVLGLLALALTAARVGAHDTRDDDRAAPAADDAPEGAPADGPPALLDAPVDEPPPSDVVPPPIEPAPLAPEAAPASPDAPAPAQPEAAAPARDGACASWPVAAGGGPLLAGALAVGGALLLPGLCMMSYRPEPSDDCGQACVNALVAVVVIAIGAVLVAGALLVLGPIAAVAVTLGGAAAAAAAGRAWWPAAVGGGLGILTSVFGVGLVVWGLSNDTGTPLDVGTVLRFGDASDVATFGGALLAATGGLVSFAGAVGLDLAFGAPADDARAPAAASARAAHTPRSSSLRTPALPRATHAMAY